ncbi:DUF5606 domain-containing protein [Bacteroidota bacterium]
MAEKKAEETNSKNPETVKEKEQEQEEKKSYLKDLMSISGHGGLFKFISQGRNGIIVESLDTGKRMQAFATMKVSALEDIAIYTEEEEVHLEEVFASIHKYENGKETISHNSSADDLKDYFSAILPDYDKDRVYVSDIKKVLNWYNLLLKYDLLKIEKEKPAKKSPAKKESNADVDAGADPDAGTDDQNSNKTGAPPKSEQDTEPA